MLTPIFWQTLARKLMMRSFLKVSDIRAHTILPGDFAALKTKRVPKCGMHYQ